MKNIIIAVDESGIATNHNRNIKKISKFMFKGDNDYNALTFIVIDKNISNKLLLKIKNFKQNYNIKTIHFTNIKYNKLGNFFLNILKDFDFKIYFSFLKIDDFYNKYKLNSNNPHIMIFKYLLERLIIDYNKSILNFFIEPINWNIDNNISSQLIDTLSISFKIKNLKTLKFLSKKEANLNYGLIEIADCISFLLSKYFLNDEEYLDKTFQNELSMRKFIKIHIFPKFNNFPNTLGYSLKKI